MANLEDARSMSKMVGEHGESWEEYRSGDPPASHWLDTSERPSS